MMKIKKVICSVFEKCAMPIIMMLCMNVIAGVTGACCLWFFNQPEVPDSVLLQEFNSIKIK